MPRIDLDSQSRDLSMPVSKIKHGEAPGYRLVTDAVGGAVWEKAPSRLQSWEREIHVVPGSTTQNRFVPYESMELLSAWVDMWAAGTGVVPPVTAGTVTLDLVFDATGVSLIGGPKDLTLLGAGSNQLSLTPAIPALSLTDTLRWDFVSDNPDLDIGAIQVRLVHRTFVV